MKRNANAILLIAGLFVLLVALNFIFFVDKSAAEEDEPGTLVLITPPDVHNPDEEEFNALNKWIEAGGLLIIADRNIDKQIGDAGIHTEHAVAKSPVRILQPTSLT